MVFFSSQHPLPQLEGLPEEDRCILEKAARLLSGCHIYVDGSFLEGRVGYGYLVIKDGEIITEEGGAVTGQIPTSSHQVGGELWAVQKALTWCQEEGVEAVTIYCDLEATIYWARGDYQARIPLTQNFKAFIDTCDVEISWQKVPAHQGEPFNERADALAKEGARQGKKPGARDGVAHLQELVQEFGCFLEEKGFTVVEKGIFNQQCAKLLLHRDGEKLGHFNVYLTKKNPSLPRYHELKEEARQLVEELWEGFISRKEG